MVLFGPPVHSVLRLIILIPSAPITFIASPLASATAKSFKVTRSEVTNSPWAPDIWFLKSRIVSFIPEPLTITSSTSKDKPSSKTKVPGESVRMSPEESSISAV